MKYRWLGAVLAGACSACVSTTPMLLPAQYEKRPNAVRHAALPCPMRLASLTDSRADPAYLGMMAGRDIRAQDFQSWARGGVEARLGAQAQPVLTLDAEVVRAYVGSLNVSRIANIVMRVRFVRDARVLGEKVYRGADTSMNWNSSDSEAYGSLNAALNNLLDQVGTDAISYCAAPTSVTEASAQGS